MQRPGLMRSYVLWNSGTQNRPWQEDALLFFIVTSRTQAISPDRVKIKREQNFLRDIGERKGKQLTRSSFWWHRIRSHGALIRSCQRGEKYFRLFHLALFAQHGGWIRKGVTTSEILSDGLI